MPRGGALPPPGKEWVLGKTAASNRFVFDSEDFLKTCKDKKKAAKLRKAIEKVKTGQLVLTEWLTPEQYIKSGAPKN